MRSTKGYMQHPIDCSQKYFQNYEGCLDKNKPTAYKKKKFCAAISFKQKLNNNIWDQSKNIKSCRMTQSLQVWGKTPDNSTRHLMTNDTLFSLLTKDKGEDWKGRDPSHKACTLIDLKERRKCYWTNRKRNHWNIFINWTFFLYRCQLLHLSVYACKLQYMTWLAGGIPEGNNMWISRPLARLSGNKWTINYAWLWS